MSIEKGLIRNLENPLCGLIGDIVHHANGYALQRYASTINSEEDRKTMLEARGQMVEDDLNTLNSALLEILEIAKTSNGQGYRRIRKIIEDKEYECGN
jgi:hypothetical protein